MRRVNIGLRQQLMSLSQQNRYFFGGHPSKTTKVDYNPDKLEVVHQNDITPEEVEQFRDVIFENRPQDKKYSWTARFSEKVLNSKIVRNKYFVAFLQNMVQDKSVSEMAHSGYINPPRLHDNSVFVCQSGELANQFIFMRSLDSYILLGSLIASVSPFYHLTMAGIVYGLGANGLLYYPSKSLVVRMDLMPHLEQLSVVRIGFNGRLYNKMYNLNTLEKIDYDELLAKKNIFGKTLQRNFDIEMIFQDSETGDYLLFDNQTVWDKEGLEHPLISSRNH